jgi:hypothetical protein
MGREDPSWVNQPEASHVWAIQPPRAQEDTRVCNSLRLPRGQGPPGKVVPEVGFHRRPVQLRRGRPFPDFFKPAQEGTQAAPGGREGTGGSKNCMDKREEIWEAVKQDRDTGACTISKRGVENKEISSERKGSECPMDEDKARTELYETDLTDRRGSITRPDDDVCRPLKTRGQGREYP